MEVLWYLSGFCWNVISMFISMLGMSNDMGWICIRHKKFFWQMDELDLIEQLGKGDPDA